MKQRESMWHCRAKRLGLKVLMRQSLNSFRCFVVVASMGAWFAASNHCALAVKNGVHEAVGSECPMHAHKQHAPLPEKGNGCGDLPCCKRLQANIVPTGKTMARPMWSGALQTFFLPAFSLVDAQKRILSPILDTGPPRENTFAELVLQRSILAHAPPAFLS
jgi:hypothetical protein